MSEEDRRRPRPRRSIFFPLLLVAIGVAFLLNNLGVIQGDLWSALLNLWPVILIVIGLDSIYRREGLVGPTFLIGLGLIFIFANLGYLTVNIWQMILTLWPILIIAIGLDILIGHRSWWLSLAGVVLMIVILVGAIYLFSAERLGEGISGEVYSQDLSLADQAEIVVTQSVGNVIIQANQQNNDQLVVNMGEVMSEDVSIEFNQSDGVATFTIDGSGAVDFLPGSSIEEWRWSLSLPTTVPVELEADMGAGELDLDLTGLEMVTASTELGVGRTAIILPSAGEFEASVDGAIGQIVVYVPEDTGIRIRPDTALVYVQVPESYTQQEDDYYSPGYESAENRVDLRVSLAIGNVVVQAFQER